MDTSKFDPWQYRRNGVVDIAKLHSKAPVPPRYLIRVHSLYSQGMMTTDSFLSAAEAFSAYNNSEAPTLREYTSAKFELHIHNHLTNYKGTPDEPFRSPFISLTVSLRTALAWAKMRSIWNHVGIRIAVLDTTTITNSNCDCDQYCRDPFHQNPIWPANMVYKACHGKTKSYPDEFVAFGHVRGTFKTCTFAELETNYLAQYLPELTRLPKSQRYEDLPITLDALWRNEQKLYPQEKEIVIHMAKQLSNDNLLIPMVAFVLCVRRRSLDDRQVLDTIVRAATLVEKQANYDFLGYFDAFPIIDFFWKKEGHLIKTADSIELVQTSAILERVKLCFAEAQEKEARRMWDCTTVALICRRFSPKDIGDAISKTSFRSRSSLTSDLTRAFSRLQVAVFRSKFSGLRLLMNALVMTNRGYNVISGTVTPVSVRMGKDHDFWTRTFGEIATQIEMYDGSSRIVPTVTTAPTYQTAAPTDYKENITMPDGGLTMDINHTELVITMQATAITGGAVTSNNTVLRHPGTNTTQMPAHVSGAVARKPITAQDETRSTI